MDESVSSTEISPLELWLLTHQWLVLTKFAKYVYKQFGRTGELPEEEPESEATRYFLFHHRLTPERWEVVEAFIRENQDTLAKEKYKTTMNRLAEMEEEYGTDTYLPVIAREYCFLLGFMAQYKAKAQEYTMEFLLKRHRLTDDEYSDLDVLLLAM